MCKEMHRWKRISRDDLRLMNDGRYTHDHESFVDKQVMTLLRVAFLNGYDVIIDCTNLRARARNRFHVFAESWGDVTVIEKLFEVPLKTILERIKERDEPNRVPEAVVLDMAKRFSVAQNGRFARLADNVKYYKPIKFSALKQDENLPNAVICDIDGTLASLNGRDPYDIERASEDTLNVNVALVLKSLSDAGMKVIMLSGRRAETREQTVRFLNDNIPSIPVEKLFLRSDSDRRPDTTFKKEVFVNEIMDRYNVRVVIEDRPKVVRMWRYELGLTVFQVDDKES